MRVTSASFFLSWDLNVLLGAMLPQQAFPYLLHNMALWARAVFTDICGVKTSSRSEIANQATLQSRTINSQNMEI